MIVIPISTDAPIYHWPYATIGLILLNIALLFAVPPASSAPRLDENDEAVEDVNEVSNFDRYALAIGDGRLHPIQWVTHNFLHYGMIHLAGNMVFLWAFGIVVEGKLGLVKYLLTYLAIGTLHGAFVQTLMVRSGFDSHAAGASAIVYGLLAVCMVWAPRNELNCIAILIFGFRTFVYHWDLHYTTVALLYIGEQVFGLVFWGASGGKVMVSELGHLSGAFWGAAVALVMLKAKLVDCEAWDLFSLWAKRRKLALDWKKREERLDHEKTVLRSFVKTQMRAKSANRDRTSDGEVPTQEERATKALGRIHFLIDSGDGPGAVAAYEKATRSLFNWPSQRDLYDLIKALHARGAEADSIRLMRDYCCCYPRDSVKVRLKLAQILMRDRQRPVAALRLLDEIPAGSLTPDLESARQKLALKAQQMLDEGVLELEGDD
jgi:membrane associated rhomboid family serine protease